MKTERGSLYSARRVIGFARRRGTRSGRRSSLPARNFKPLGLLQRAQAPFLYVFFPLLGSWFGAVDWTLRTLLTLLLFNQRLPESEERSRQPSSFPSLPSALSRFPSHDQLPLTRYVRSLAFHCSLLILVALLQSSSQDSSAAIFPFFFEKEPLCVRPRSQTPVYLADSLTRIVPSAIVCASRFPASRF